jgi:hypothetical protein
MDFPLMFAILFDTDIMKNLHIDFTPENIKEFKDTGYELKKKYFQKGYKGKLLLDRNTRSYKLGPFKELICAEYYLNRFDHIFASHFGRGSTLGKSKYLNTKKRFFYKLPIIGSFLLTLKGKKEKKKWINICKRIVDN